LLWSDLDYDLVLMHSDDSNKFADYLYQGLKKSKLDVFRYEEDVTFGHSECSIIMSIVSVEFGQDS